MSRKIALSKDFCTGDRKTFVNWDTGIWLFVQIFLVWILLFRLHLASYERYWLSQEGMEGRPADRIQLEVASGSHAGEESSSRCFQAIDCTGEGFEHI